jgi:hypothetical protein
MLTSQCSQKIFNFAHTHTDPSKSYDRGSSLQKLQLLFSVNCTIEKIYEITSVLDTFLFGWVSSDWIEVQGLVRKSICRFPRCNLKLASNTSRWNHERLKQSQKSNTCEKC